MRVDRRRRRQELEIGSAEEHLARDAAADRAAGARADGATAAPAPLARAAAAGRAAGERDDVAIAALARADSLRRSERDVLCNQHRALLLRCGLPAGISPPR